MKIKKKDQVLIISGKDKGKKGEVIEALPVKQKVMVKGINLVKKHVKKSKENPSGGYVEIEAMLSASNVMLFCPKCTKGVKVSIVVDNGVKKRVCKKCNHKFE